MSALSSPLNIGQTHSLPAAPVRMESAEQSRVQARTILSAVAGQLRALFLAQRSLSGQFGSTAYVAEDDYRRFANRSC
jgi:hypothetical protein